MFKVNQTQKKNMSNINIKQQNTLNYFNVPFMLVTMNTQHHVEIVYPDAGWTTRNHNQTT